MEFGTLLKIGCRIHWTAMKYKHVNNLVNQQHFQSNVGLKKLNAQSTTYVLIFFLI